MSEQTFSCIVLSMCMCLMKVEPNIRKEANYGFLVYIILKKFLEIFVKMTNLEIYLESRVLMHYF